MLGIIDLYSVLSKLAGRQAKAYEPRLRPAGHGVIAQTRRILEFE